MRIICLCIALLTQVCFGSARVYSGEAESYPSATDIVNRAFHVYSGDDSFSRANFTFHVPGDIERRLVVAMAWKQSTKNHKPVSKVIMFNEFPPDTKGISFLGWLYPPELSKKDDMWLYLPGLMSIRKLTHKQDDYSHHDNSDAYFINSELTINELFPRHPPLDTHELLGTEILEGQNCFIISSTPKDPQTSPFSKSVTWITLNTYLPLKTDYYDQENNLAKQVSITWENIDNAWVWKQVSGSNTKTGNTTVLDHTDVRINIGIKDDLFTKRMMMLGIDAFEAKINSLGETH